MATTITSNTVNVTITPANPSNYGLVCKLGYYMCVSGAGASTLSQCQANPDYGKKC
jgi:hypothetical protein